LASRIGAGLIISKPSRCAAEGISNGLRR
jgi:hypothetical protein